MDREAELALKKTGLSDDQVESMIEMERWRDEPLVPELQAWVEDSPFGPCLKHPLVYSVPLIFPGQANMALRRKKAALDKAVAEEDWSTVIWIHERPYRFDALIDYVVGRDEFDEVFPLKASEQYARDLAADVWVDSENIHQHIDGWMALFEGWNCGNPMLFNDDPEGWEKLPDPLRVYRAGIDDGGWSWTLDLTVAQFFANRFGKQHVMSVGKVKKECVFGYLTRRSEAEVLVPDGTVTNIRRYAETVGTD